MTLAMEKDTEAAPPPYETLTRASTNAKEDAKAYDTLAVPRRLMDKVFRIRPHAERMRLIEEYIGKKGEVIEAREAALTHQDGVLAEAIKRVKSDVKGIHGATTRALWNVALRSKHLVRGYIAAVSKYGDLKSEAAAFPELIAAGEEEACRTYQMEVRKIETEFRDAAKQLDVEYMALLENMLAEMER
ncbi:hypothetical protein J3F83DRAFT_723112 [Trichoderma novae-zelandiae]